MLRYEEWNIMTELRNSKEVLIIFADFLSFYMTSHLFFAIQAGIQYQQLKRPLTFACDHYGLSNWLLRFPLTLYSPDLAEKHVFTEDTVSISTHNGPIEQERWKYLVLTQNDGKRLYCTAQLYYEQARVKQCLRLNRGQNLVESQQFFVPKWLVFLSEEPYFKLQVNLLKIFRQLCKPNSALRLPTPPQPLHLTPLHQHHQTPPLHQHHRSSSCNDCGPEYLAAFSIQQAMEYYVWNCNQHRGADSILLQKHNNTPVLHLYQLKEQCLFQLAHFLTLPLSSKNIQLAVTAILLEKQLVVVSRSSNLNVMLIESLLQIVRPLKWQHMLVHNLPAHLIEAANQNFMPFIVGVNRTDLHLIHTTDRFLIIVDEDRVVKPETLPALNFGDFPPQLHPTFPSHVNQKMLLQSSIQFMCALLQPLVRNHSQLPSAHKQFYDCFQHKTTMFDSFMQNYESGQLKQFARLLALQQPERKQQIQQKLSQQVYFFQHPKFLINQTQWLQFTLGTHTRQREVFAPRENKFNLRELTQNVPSDKADPRLQRPFASNSKELKGKEHKVMERTGTSRPRSIQRVKVSIVKRQNRQAFMAELLENKIGVSSRMG